jgi:DNA repair protein RadA/Sms
MSEESDVVETAGDGGNDPTVDRFYCAGFDRKHDDGTPFCTHRAPKRWLGRCPQCHRWYDCLLIRNPRSNDTKKRLTFASSEDVKPVKRVKTRIPEVDLVTGGGFAEGAVYLLCGEPGGGKSTLAKQILDKCANEKCPALYTQSEQSKQQVLQELERLEIRNRFVELCITQEATDVVLLAEEMKPKIIVVDSMNKLAVMGCDADYNTPKQLKAISTFLRKYVVEKNIVLIFICHQTKAGELTVPRELEHDFDCTMFFDRYGSFKDGSPNPGDYTEDQKEIPTLRVLKSHKNRYGSSERAVLEMTDKGLTTPQKISKVVSISAVDRLERLRKKRDEED